MRISIGQIKKRSVFKLTFFSALALFAPFWLIVSGMSVMGYDAVRYNDNYVYGFTAILVATVLVGIFSALIAVHVTLGAWILSKLAPKSAAITVRDDGSSEVRSSDNGL